jgi:hypothetical protein
VGFSARQLTEALARFWDIHICGPARLLRQHHEWRAQQEAVGLPQQHAVRLPSDELLEREGEETSLTDEQPIKVKKYTSFAFDALMSLEDDYAIPYRLLLKQVGSRLAVILFPIIAYFSLQTRFPLRVYEAALNEVREKVRLPQNV